MITFGPIPSRRLGRSLGINNIPPKICSYACVYCQLGRAIKMQAEREFFYPLEQLKEEVADRKQELSERDERLDYATFVPDGEPTLEAGLGEQIKAVKDLGIKTAVITNSSLLDRVEVRRALSYADWVSCKLDTADEDVWRKINRPLRSFKLESIINGIKEFRSSFSGRFVTETMLVDGINTGEEALTRTAEQLSKIAPDMAYISAPTRPPAEDWVSVPGEDIFAKAHEMFSSFGAEPELIIAYEGDEFSAGSDFADDLLRITAVHPMRRKAVDKLMRKHGASGKELQLLLDKRLLTISRYRGDEYLCRNLKREGKFRKRS